MKNQKLKTLGLALTLLSAFFLLNFNFLSEDFTHKSNEYNQELKISDSSYPKFCTHDITDPNKIAAISKLRSCEFNDWMDYDDVELQMTNELKPLESIDEKSIPIYSPVNGEIITIFDYNGDIVIKADGYDCSIRILGFNYTANFDEGKLISAGEYLGHFDDGNIHSIPTILTWFHTYYGTDSPSIFSLFTDTVFENYQRKGIEHRDVLIKSKVEAKESPYLSIQENPDIWVYLDHDGTTIHNESSFKSYSNEDNSFYAKVSSFDGNLGQPHDIAIQNDFAYIASQHGGLVILDIMDPSNPKIISNYSDDGIAYGIFVSSDYAYVANGKKGLNIFNISNPYEIKKIASVPLPDTSLDVVLEGNFAYLACYSAGLCIVNVSDKFNPTYTTGFPNYYDDQGKSFKLEVRNGFVYIADGNGAFEVIDVNDPYYPQKVFQSSHIGWPRDISLYGDCAYVLGGHTGLHIYNITDPKNIQKITELPFSYTTDYIDIENNIAYITRYWGELYTVDISDPHNPVVLWGPMRWDNYYVKEIVVVNSEAYLVSESDGLIFVDVSNPSSPIKTNEFFIGGYANDVLVNGKIAYVANYRGGIDVLDISDPLRTQKITTIKTTYMVRSLSMNDGYLFVSTGERLEFEYQFKVYDISNSSNPTYLRDINTNSYVVDHHIYNNNCLVVLLNGDFEIYDVSNPSNLVDRLSTFSAYGDPKGIYAYNNYAYIANGTSGLEIVDISDPSIPNRVSGYDQEGYAFDVFVSGDYAYLANGWHNLEIVNISIPSSPEKVSNYNNGGYSYNIYLKDTQVYLSKGIDGIEVIDVSNVSSPKKEGTFHENLCSNGISVNESLVYAAGGWDGLTIIGFDQDNDTLSDYFENHIGTNITNPDTDDDGMSDGYEVENGLDPKNSTDANQDLDNDGLTNLEEYQHDTDPYDADTDDDGMLDGWEINNALDPTRVDSHEDPDADNLPNLGEYNWNTNPQDSDSDNDGMPDGWEVGNNLEPLIDDSQLDPDNDTLINLYEYGNNTLARVNDTDSDKMPDGWEVFNDLNPLYNDSAEDPDDDGFTNLEEYKNGTDPHSSDLDGTTSDEPSDENGTGDNSTSDDSTDDGDTSEYYEIPASIYEVIIVTLISTLFLIMVIFRKKEIKM